jgi:hypothetical protein
VKTVGFWDAEHDQQWGLDWHRNEGLELTYLERGTLAFGVDDHQYALHPDDLTITRPWQPHRVGTPHVTAGRLHWVILDVGVRHPHHAWRWPGWLVLTKADIQELTNFLRQNEQPVWHASEEIDGRALRLRCNAISEAFEATNECDPGASFELLPCRVGCQDAANGNDQERDRSRFVVRVLVEPIFRQRLSATLRLHAQRVPEPGHGLKAEPCNTPPRGSC